MDATINKRKEFWISFKEIILFSLPLIATGILQLLYNAMDIVVVGQFQENGSTHMAAVGSTSSVVHLFTMLFMGLSVGTLSVMSKSIGAKNQDYADKVVHTSIPLSVIGGVVFGVIGYVFCEELLVIMKSPENVLPLSTLYLKIYFAGLPFLTLYNFGSSILRACGDTKRPLIILAISGIINVIINYVLVAWFALGVVGVAVGTVVSEVVSAVAIMVLLVRQNGYGNFVLKKMKIDMSALKEIIEIGLPAGIQSTIFSISNVIVQSSINDFKELVMAGNSASASIEGFIFLSLNSISQACLTFVSKNYGAKDIKKMRFITYQSLLMLTVLAILMGGIAVILAKPLLSLYNGDERVIAYGVERLRIIASTYILCGIGEVLIGSLRGMGVSILPMVCGVACVCGFRIFWIYTVFASFPTTVMLYLSYPLSWLLAGIVHLVCYLIVRKIKENQIKKQLVEND